MGAISIPLSQLEPRLTLPAQVRQPPSQPGLRWQADEGGQHDDEIEDLVALLMEHATYPGVLSRHLARALAEASMGPNHLWEDLGLLNRVQLNELMQEHFTSLRVLNVNNMRWKKFFYRTLCERADILICKSPHCEQCDDKPQCFE